MPHRGVISRVVFDDNGQGVRDLDVHVVDVYPIPIIIFRKGYIKEQREYELESLFLFG